MVKTRILIISDTHCAPLSRDAPRRAPETPFVLPLPKADLLIHCGDLTNTGEQDEYHQTLDMLKQIDAPVKLVIAGNHDLSLDRDFVMSHRTADKYGRMPHGLSESDAETRYRQARQLWTGSDERAKREGVTFLDEGVHLIRLENGASINLYASPYTPEFYDWGFPYERNEDRFNEPQTSLSDAVNTASQIIPSRDDAERPVDVVVTHGPAWLRLDPTTRGDPAGCPHLLRALMRARPLIHCFGHIHEGWGAERASWAPNASELAQRQESIATFRSTGWKDAFVKEPDGLCGIDEAELKDKHAVHVDVSQTGPRPVQLGKETAFINAAIMDVHYKPVNAPWLIDVDLPGQ